MKRDEQENVVETDEPLEEQVNQQAAKSEKKKKAGKSKAGRGKIKKLEQEKVKLEEELEQLKDKYLRLAAEFENFKKLKVKEVKNRIQNVKEALILDVLPVLDDLDRTLAAVTEEEKNGTIGNGVMMIRNNMKQILSGYGLQEIKSIGEEFDVDIHEAMMMVKDEKYPANTVVQEHQKGYKLNDRVLRHAKVAVSKPETEDES